MIWLAVFVAVVLVVVTVAAVLGRVDGSLADSTTTMSHLPLPQDPLTAADLDGLRFDTAFRGYRMSEVDAVIDRLRREIDDLSAPHELVTFESAVERRPEPAMDDRPSTDAETPYSKTPHAETPHSETTADSQPEPARSGGSTTD